MTFLTSSGSSSARYPDGPDDGADCSMAPIVPSEDDDANASMAPIGPPVWVVEPNNTLAFISMSMLKITLLRVIPTMTFIHSVTG